MLKKLSLTAAALAFGAQARAGVMPIADVEAEIGLDQHVLMTVDRRNHSRTSIRSTEFSPIPVDLAIGDGPVKNGLVKGKFNGENVHLDLTWPAWGAVRLEGDFTEKFLVMQTNMRTEATTGKIFIKLAKSKKAFEEGSLIYNMILDFDDTGIRSSENSPNPVRLDFIYDLEQDDHAYLVGRISKIRSSIRFKEFTIADIAHLFYLFLPQE